MFTNRDELRQRLDELSNKIFPIVDVNEFLPYAGKVRAYTGEFSAITSATGGEATFSEIIQADVIITTAYVSVYYAESGNTRVVIPENSARDIYKISLTSNNAVLFNKPMDIFAFNNHYKNNALARIGMFLPRMAEITGTLIRTQKTTAVNGNAITASLTLKGFEI